MIFNLIYKKICGVAFSKWNFITTVIFHGNKPLTFQKQCLEVLDCSFQGEPVVLILSQQPMDIINRRYLISICHRSIPSIDWVGMFNNMIILCVTCLSTEVFWILMKLFKKSYMWFIYGPDTAITFCYQWFVRTMLPRMDWRSTRNTEVHADMFHAIKRKKMETLMTRNLSPDY